jgi:peptidyl-prolyl cis-trans isomerase SurA
MSIGWLVMAAAALFPPPADAQRVQRIAAIVNDDVVSEYDLRARMQVVIASSGLRPTEQLQQRIGQQVLRNLIDERLQMQEAKRLNISVSKKDLSAATASIEKQNNLPPGTFDEFLRKNGLPRESVLDQIRAQIAWQKLVGRMLVPRVTVGNEEVDDALARLREAKGQWEYHILEILLTVDRPEQEGDVRRAAQRLVDELRRGARFEAVARQFSQTASASVGGDLGWMQEATMGDELREVVSRMDEGRISDPVQILGGIQILKLEKKRRVLGGSPADTVVDLQQILLPVRNGAGQEEAASQQKLAQLLSESVSGCDDHARAATESNSTGPTSLGEIRMGDLAPAVRSAVENLAVGKASAPVRNPNGYAVLMVCSRKEVEDGLPSRAEILDRLQRNRLGILTRRYLRDLRAAAVVDLRV